MAIYHCTAKMVSRGRGSSVLAKAAYNAREAIKDFETGEVRDFRRDAADIGFSGIFAPKNAPAWARKRSTLWNAVEASEKRIDAQTAREIEIALPHELTFEQNRWLVTDFVRENFVRQGMVADVNIHVPGESDDPRNIHAHILLTTRSIDENGFGPKVREWNSKAQLETWRENWENLANRYLERFGHEARIDRRTLEAQGIDREPGQHKGPAIQEMEDRGVVSEVEERRREEAANDNSRDVTSPTIAALEAELADVKLAIIKERADKMSEDADLHWAVSKIRATYQISDTPYEFRDLLGRQGFELGRADAEDVFRAREQAGREEPDAPYKPRLRPDNFYIADRYGNYYALTQKATDRSATQVSKFLSPLNDEIDLPTVREAEKRALDQAAKAKVDPVLSATAGNIRLAYAVSNTPDQFKEALEERRLRLACADIEDVVRSKEAAQKGLAQGRQMPILSVGQFVVVDRFGRTHGFYERTTADTHAETDKFLAPLRDENMVPSIRQAIDGLEKDTQRKRFELELSERVGDIRIAYALSDKPTQFIEALKDKGLVLAKVDLEDAAISAERWSQRLAEGKFVPTLNASDMVVVDRHGFTYPLYERTTGDTSTEVAKFLTAPYADPNTPNVRRATEIAGRWWQECQPSDDLIGTVADIRVAYGISENADQFKEALAERGIWLAQVSDRDNEELAQYYARRSPLEPQSEFSFEDGEYVAVNTQGYVYSLTTLTTGESRADAQEFCKALDGDKTIQSVTSTVREFCYDWADHGRPTQDTTSEIGVIDFLHVMRQRERTAERGATETLDRFTKVSGKLFESAADILEGLFDYFAKIIEGPEGQPSRNEGGNEQPEPDTLDLYRYARDLDYRRFVIEAQEAERNRLKDQEDYQRRSRDRER